MERILRYILAAIAIISILTNTTIFVSASNATIRPSFHSPYSVDFLDDGILVTYDFTKNDSIDREFKLSSLSFKGFDNVMIGDTLCLPKRTDCFTLPFKCSPKFELIKERHRDIDMPTELILSVKAKKDIGNNDFCKFLPLQRYRNYPVAMVNVSPIRIIDGKIRIYDQIQYKLHYNLSNARSKSCAIFESESLIDPNSLYSTGLLTPTLPPLIDIVNLPLKTPGYLIISVPKFREHLEPFIKWKKIFGYTVYEAYDDSWTPEKIKATVRNLYQEHNDLQYLMIVGDHSLVPGEFKISQPYENSNLQEEFITDFYYGCMENDEQLSADIYRGRWPVRTIWELENIIEKSIRYEMEPNTDPQFYNSAAHFGYFEDDISLAGMDPDHKPYDGIEDKRFVRTCEDVRDYLLENDLMSHIDRLYTAKVSIDPNRTYPRGWETNNYGTNGLMTEDLSYENGFLWNANSDSVTNAINNGRLYFLYRGHGFPNGWGLLGNNYAQFGSNEISRLSNINAMPLILSITCKTGDHRVNDNFVRDILSSPLGGTYGIFAQTATGKSGVNDMLTSFFINCIWPTPGLNLEKFEISDYWERNPDIHNSLPTLRLGQMLDISINGTASFYSLSNDITSVGLYKKMITHCFGDPSILFRKTKPTPQKNIFVARNRENGTVNVSSLDLGNRFKYISFYDKTTDKSVLYRGTEATYTCSAPGAERYVDVLVYNNDNIPYFDQGENYEGSIQPEDQTRLISNSLHTNGKYLTVNYYLSEKDRGKIVELLVVDLETNNFIFSDKVDSTICGEQTSAPVYVNNGIMMISLMVNGIPYSTMKVFVPLH